MKYTVVTIHIYDKRKGLLNLDLDNITVGSALNLLIISCSGDKIMGSLRNSLIYGSRQYNLGYNDPIEKANSSIFYRLGNVLMQGMFSKSLSSKIQILTLLINSLFAMKISTTHLH
jgi:hypothetical protein